MVSTFFGCKSTNYLLCNCKILRKKVYFDNLFSIICVMSGFFYNEYLTADNF